MKNIGLNKQIKYLIIGIVLLFSQYSNVYSFQAASFKWQIGEELTYKVSWEFIRIGTVSLSVVDTVTIHGAKTYHLKMKIDSSPWLFFVNMHSEFDSYLTEDTYPRLLICKEEIDGDDYDSRYQFDYENKEIVIHHEGVENPDKKIDKRMPLEKQIQDGISIIFYARKNCTTSKKEKLFVIAEAKEGVLDINFTGKTKDIEISIAQNKAPAYYINGEAHFKSIAGFSGGYKGWFSLDERRVPLAAEMKVFIGSVYLELEDWKNWQPDFTLED